MAEAAVALRGAGAGAAASRAGDGAVRVRDLALAEDGAVLGVAFFAGEGDAAVDALDGVRGFLAVAGFDTAAGGGNKTRPKENRRLFGYDVGVLLSFRATATGMVGQHLLGCCGWPTAGKCSHLARAPEAARAGVPGPFDAAFEGVRPRVGGILR